MPLCDFFRFGVQVVNPNFGFWQQLCTMEEAASGGMSMPLDAYVLQELRTVWPDHDIELQKQVAQTVASDQSTWLTGTVFDALLHYSMQLTE